MSTHIRQRRQFERWAVDVPVALTVAADPSEQIVLTAGASLSGRMKDVSGSGARVVVGTFLPRGARLELNVPATGGLPGGRVRCCVMLARMLDREPHYSLGLRFEEPDSALVHWLQQREPQERSE